MIIIVNMVYKHYHESQSQKCLSSVAGPEQIQRNSNMVNIINFKQTAKQSVNDNQDCHDNHCKHHKHNQFQANITKERCSASNWSPMSSSKGSSFKKRELC